VATIDSSSTPISLAPLAPRPLGDGERQHQRRQGGKDQPPFDQPADAEDDADDGTRQVGWPNHRPASSMAISTSV
jgi:hypothetical protein